MFWKKKKKPGGDNPFFHPEWHKKVDDPDKIIGVTMDWGAHPCLAFAGGHIYGSHTDKILYPEYYKYGDWPTDPETGEKLPIEPMGGR